MVSSYCIEIRGIVPPVKLEIYQDEFAIERGEEATFMTGSIQDASQLHGIVSHLTSLGLELVEVRRTHRASGAPVKALDD